MSFLRALVLSGLVLATPLLAAAPPTEYEVKAVFLFNFSRFVEWPPQSFGAADAPFPICIVGTDRFGGALDSTVHGESVQGHPFVVKRYGEVAQVDSSCHILFISDSEAPHLEQITGTLSGRSILTVSDINESAERGAMIQFTNERNRLRLRINLSAAKTAGLTISSKLLRPAEIIGPDRG
jgi:hypothetical protein